MVREYEVSYRLTDWLHTVTTSSNDFHSYGLEKRGRKPAQTCTFICVSTFTYF